MEETNIHEFGSVIKIDKSDRRLGLWKEGRCIHEFRIGLGFSPDGNKIREGDGRTPVGQYYICTKNPQSRFTLFLGISYPNIEDANRGLKNGLINEEEYNKIKKSIEKRKRPDWSTQLGGKIGIHGKGSSFDWTAGCISLNDADIQTLWDLVELGTPVVISE